MGWTKHSDAVQAHRVARSEVHASIKSLAKVLTRELESPDDVTGNEIFVLACDLHSELKRFARLRHAVGGQEEVNLRPYIGLLLDAVHQFKWSSNG